MRLGIFLPFGSSIKDQEKSGQAWRLINYYLKQYRLSFEKNYLFSYEKESSKLPKDCLLVSNDYSLNHILYSFLIVFLKANIIKKIDIFRVLQLTGTIPAILIKILYHKPYIFTYGYDYESLAKLENKKIRAILLKILKYIAVKTSDGIIVTNKYFGLQLAKLYPKAKLFYLPNGVDINKFKIQNSKFKILSKNSIIKILFVGRLEKQKNLENLIKGIALINQKYKIKLIIIGQGKLKIKLLKLANHLKVNLKIISNISHNKLPAYYQKADLFCLPSFLEGQPKALLEAMSCGLPCLVGQYLSAGEFIHKKEVYYTGFSAKNIAKNMDLLISNPNLRRLLKKNARKKIEKYFDIQKILKKEIQVLIKNINAS